MDDKRLMYRRSKLRLGERFLFLLGNRFGALLVALVGKLDMLLGTSLFPLGSLLLLLFQPFGMIMVAEHVRSSTVMRAPFYNCAHDWVLRGLPNLGITPFVGRLLVPFTSKLGNLLGSFTRSLAGGSTLKLGLEIIHLGGESDDLGVS